MGVVRNFRSDAIQTMIDNVDTNVYGADGKKSIWDTIQNAVWKHFLNGEALKENLEQLDLYLAYIMETEDITAERLAERLQEVLDGVKEVEDRYEAKFKQTAECLETLTNKLKTFEEKIEVVAVVPLGENEERMGDGGVITRDTENPDGIIPAHSSDNQPVDLPVANAPGQRSPQAYIQVLESANVNESYRYEARVINGRYTTFCIFFVWDVTRAMGCEIPHQYDLSTGEAVSNEEWDYPNNQNHKWMTANDMVDWLRKFGPGNGWQKLSAEQAIEMANKGLPVVAAAKNPGGIGHVAMVCPQQGDDCGTTQVMTYQAGGRNFEYGKIEDGFTGLLSSVEFYYHI